MVLVPWGRDQPGVAARAKALGVAAVVPRHHCTAANLADAISRVLGNVRHAGASRHASRRLRANDALTKGDAYIEKELQADDM